MELEFHTLDVFTETLYEGNPLAVVLGADELDGNRMQAIAREFNLSETVFVLPAEHVGHTAKVRIFTPTAELPFAGHPTIGTAVLLARERLRNSDRTDDAIVVLEEGIGPVRVGVRFRKGKAAFAEFDTVRLPEEDGPVPPDDRYAAALGLAPNEIGFENHRPVRFTAGVPFSFVPVRNLESIGRSAVDLSSWDEAFGGDGHAAAYIYCRETVHRTSDFRARLFAPRLLSGEDPATGSAAAAFAAVIDRFDAPRDGSSTYLIEQGYEMGRPSEIRLELEIGHKKLRAVRIGGHAVQVMKGEISV